MTPNLLTALIMFLAAQTCIIVSGFLVFAMIGEINRQVSEDQRIAYLGGDVVKFGKIFREYRRLYPGGRLAFYSNLTAALAMFLMLAAAWQFGVFNAVLHAMSMGSPGAGR